MLRCQFAASEIAFPYFKKRTNLLFFNLACCHTLLVGLFTHCTETQIKSSHYFQRRSVFASIRLFGSNLIDGFSFFSSWVQIKHFRSFFNLSRDLALDTTSPHRCLYSQPCQKSLNIPLGLSRPSLFHPSMCSIVQEEVGLFLCHSRQRQKGKHSGKREGGRASQPASQF